MAYPPPVTKKERLVLNIIGRGHPERSVRLHGTRGTGANNALEWTEVQIASGLPSKEFPNCIAHLVAGNLVDTGKQLPGLLGRLMGKKEQIFFWITETGRGFLTENSEDDTPEEIALPTLSEASSDDIVDAVRIYENCFAASPYVKPEQVRWAQSMLDDDVKLEVKSAALEMVIMWDSFEKMFGHRSAASSEKEAGVRDPAVKRSTIRIIRARDEQLRRRGFPPSRKPESWATHYNNGEVGLAPAPWQ